MRLSLTAHGEETLQELSKPHVRELQQLAPAMLALLPEPGGTGAGSPPE